MKDYRTYVGLDVHKASISAVAIDTESGVMARTRLGWDIEGLCRWLSDLEGPVTCCYESGFCGFSLKRALGERDMHCDVIATSKLAKPSGDRIKTDRRDAEFLARQYLARNVRVVATPELETEGLRDLSRLHASLRDTLSAAKHRVSQMCLRYGVRYEGKEGKWTQAHMRWLRGTRMPTDLAQEAFDTYLDQVMSLVEEKRRIALRIEGLCREEPLRRLIDALCAIKGISHISAFCLVSEIGDFTRFTHAPLFASFLGLVPSEHSSGEKTSRGPITKTGNRQVRRMLTEVAMCIIRQRSVHKACAEDVPAPIRRMAAKANRRLAKKRDSLKAKGKHVCKIAIACARELAGFIWAIASCVQLDEMRDSST
jgi:transposase